MRAGLVVVMALVIAGPAAAQDAEGSSGGGTDTDSDNDTDTDTDTDADSDNDSDSDTDSDNDTDTRRHRPSDAVAYDSTRSDSDAAAALGTTTVLSAVALLSTLGYWLERGDAVASCETLETADPPRRGCVNLVTLRDQRDVGLGLFVGFAVETTAVAIAWAVVAATDSPDDEADDAEEARVRCVPTGLGAACVGRF